MAHHYLDDSNYLDPPEYDDPLEGVEHPRERKPWKRDRHAVQLAMQRAFNERVLANPMFPGHLPADRCSKDHALGFREMAYFHHEFGRFRWESKHNGWRRAVYFDNLARLHRILESVSLFDPAPLP